MNWKNFLLNEDELLHIQKFKNPEELNVLLGEKASKAILQGKLDGNAIEAVVNLVKEIYIYPDKITDIISFRIQRHDIMMGLLKHRRVLNPSEFRCIVIEQEEYKYWNDYSIKVKNKHLLNFPILYFYHKENRNGYFEMWKWTLYNEDKLSSINSDLANEILFQKLAILYTLMINGVSSSNYVFQIIKLTNPFEIIYDIKGLQFRFNFTVLVLLDPTTRLVGLSNFESTYLSALKLPKTTSLDFITVFVELFRKDLNLNRFTFAPQTLNLINDPLDNPVPGNIVIYKSGNNSAMGIVTKRLNDNCTVLLFSHVTSTKNFIETVLPVSSLHSVKNIYTLDRSPVIKLE
jgi:hypothetical protein